MQKVLITLSHSEDKMREQEMIAQQDQYIIKKINTEQTFSDIVFKSARAERFGITFCCPLDVDNITSKKELCDWEELKVPIYTTKTYAYEEWINVGGVQAPDWGDPECTPTEPCQDDKTCLFFEVINQNGDPIKGHVVAVDGGNINPTDEYGHSRTQILNASVDTVHTIDLCNCINTIGNCSQMKITLTLTEECPKTVCTDPVPACSSVDNFIEEAI